MIQAELVGRKALPAILTAVSIPGKKIAPVESQGPAVHSFEPYEAYHARNLDFEVYGPYPIVSVVFGFAT